MHKYNFQCADCLASLEVTANVEPRFCPNCGNELLTDDFDDEFLEDDDEEEDDDY